MYRCMSEWKAYNVTLDGHIGLFVKAMDSTNQYK